MNERDNQEAERAAPDGLREQFNAAFLSMNGFHTKAELQMAWDRLYGMLFRAGAAAAPAVGEDGLPPMPKEEFCAWVQHGKVVNAFTHGVGNKALWDRGGYWSSKGFDREPLYTAEQYRQGQREAFEAGRHNGWFDGAGDVAELTASPQQPDGLPPLPEPDGSASVPVDAEKFTFTEVDAWSKSLVIQFAHDAVAADRLARPQQIADVILHLIGECVMDWIPGDYDEPFSSDDAECKEIVRLVNQALVARVQNTSKNVHNDAIQSVIACAQRVHAKFGADSDWSEWRDLGDALKELGAQHPASAAQGVKTWQERMPEHVKFIGSASSELPYMKAEIDDLRNFTASLQASFDAAVSLARETIDARNAEINDLRAQLARKSQDADRYHLVRAQLVRDEFPYISVQDGPESYIDEYCDAEVAKLGGAVALPLGAPQVGKDDA